MLVSQLMTKHKKKDKKRKLLFCPPRNSFLAKCFPDKLLFFFGLWKRCLKEGEEQQAGTSSPSDGPLSISPKVLFVLVLMNLMICCRPKKNWIRPKKKHGWFVLVVPLALPTRWIWFSKPNNFDGPNKKDRNGDYSSLPFTRQWIKNKRRNLQL